MPEAQQTKNHFQINKGLNTESNEISFPDGFTVDEANYELLVDGSRKRRRGLAAEASAGAAKSVGTINAASAFQSYIWKNVGGDSTKKFIVHQVGSSLYFTNDAEIISTTYHAETVDLTVIAAEATPTTANIRDNLVSFSQGRGHLFVTGPFLLPSYIQYNSSTDDFTVKPITFLIRDFEGIKDGVTVTKEPVGTITSDHRYNLRNRGWKQDDMDSFLSDVTKHPAKNAFWYKGYKRTYGASILEEDGNRSWDSTKMDAEVFSNASAPQGSLLLYPIDTTFSYSIAGSGAPITPSTWGKTGTSTWTVTFTVASHTFSVTDEITISGNSFRYNLTGDGDVLASFDGTHTLTAETATTLVFVVTAPTNFASFFTQFLSIGEISSDVSLIKSDGSIIEVGPRANEFHQGRLWLAGLDDAQWADHIFFSRVALQPDAYSQFFQEGDPTSENFNVLTPSDGGVIVIPGMGTVVDMKSVRNSILIFAEEGVWEISGVGRSFFEAGKYEVRQITEAPCTSARGIRVIEDSVIFTGPGGIYGISPNEFTGVLEANSLTDTLIQKLWNQITDAKQNRVQTLYDRAQRRLYFLLGATATNHLNDTMLVLDLRSTAYSKYTFNIGTNSGILTGYAITNADDTSDNKKMKFTYEASATTIQTADFDQTDYVDYDAAESPLPFAITGWDNIGDFQRRRQAPVITMFAKRTETGYTSTGNGFDGDNESSTLLTARWDWTDDSVTGKIGSQNETYRHTRMFVPSGASDVDGYPVVVTRNKVRGRGRVLQLRFDGAATKDSHILGFTTNYKVSRRI